MKAVATLLSGLALAVALGGCASAPPMPPAADLFHDEAFAPAATPIDARAALAVSPAMRRYLADNFMQRNRLVDQRSRLVGALYRGDLRLEYDAAMTRTAAEAFDARTGNCLALVLMTAALAKELGMEVHYQVVLGDEVWNRSNDIYISMGHVNLRLENPSDRMVFPYTARNPIVVDFTPPENANLSRTRQIGERTLLAMFLNNRAVESLTQGRIDDAYWYAREAVRTDPDDLGAYVTLGVIYRGQRHADWAEAVFRRVAEREPDNVLAMSNRVLALRDLGRAAEATALAQRLEQLDPHPPFVYFREGMDALRAGDVERARRLFTKEVRRAPYHHEFEYWLAVTYMELKDVDRATLHLTRAMDVSTTRKDHDLYAGKLDRLKALRAQ